MNFILTDGPYRDNLLPFTYTRPVSDIQVGISTIREKWELALNATTTYHTEDYLSEKFPLRVEDDNTVIIASYLPSQDLVEKIRNLKSDEAIAYNDEVIAYRTKSITGNDDFSRFKKIDFSQEPISIKNTWDIFSKNGEVIASDFEELTKSRASQSLSSTVNVIGNGKIFVEEGAKLECVTLNPTNGPIYLGRNSEIMEGSLIRGPFALCENAIVKLGAKIYGPTTIGPNCKVGGEINNSVLFKNSNKGHDGFLGNSVLGEWCNIGADSNNSNLKNNYAEVRLWNYKSESFARTGLQFCGLMMGDHSKCGINTMFNTGTVVGVNANIYGGGFPRNFIPSFSWGGNSGFTTYTKSKAYQVAKMVMSRRNQVFDMNDEKILDKIFEMSSKYRRD